MRTEGSEEINGPHKNDIQARKAIHLRSVALSGNDGETILFDASSKVEKRMGVDSRPKKQGMGW